MENIKVIINEHIVILQNAASVANRQSILLLSLGLILLTATTYPFLQFVTSPERCHPFNLFTHQMLDNGLLAVARISLLTTLTLRFRKYVIIISKTMSERELSLNIRSALYGDL